MCVLSPQVGIACRQPFRPAAQPLNAFRERHMPTLWDDKIKNRNPKQLTIFVAPRLNKPWRRAFDDALKTFNRLSSSHQLGVTMVETNTKPDPDGDGGADVQFDMGKGDLTYTAYGQTKVVKGYSGLSM